jgi:hypothetical protein
MPGTVEPVPRRIRGIPGGTTTWRGPTTFLTRQLLPIAGLIAFCIERPVTYFFRS